MLKVTGKRFALNQLNALLLCRWKFVSELEFERLHARKNQFASAESKAKRINAINMSYS
jgi:hypothetical protein